MVPAAPAGGSSGGLAKSGSNCERGVGAGGAGCDCPVVVAGAGTAVGARLERQRVSSLDGMFGIES
jgi:hypothetical protein